MQAFATWRWHAECSWTAVPPRPRKTPRSRFLAALPATGGCERGGKRWLKNITWPMCMYIYIYLHMYMFIFLSLYLFTYEFVYVSMYFTYLSIYLFLYLFIYLYIHTHIWYVWYVGFAESRASQNMIGINNWMLGYWIIGCFSSAACTHSLVGGEDGIVIQFWRWRILWMLKVYPMNGWLMMETSVVEALS